MLKNPAYFHFNFTAVIVAFISAAFGFRVLQIWKLDLKPQISLNISLEFPTINDSIVCEEAILVVASHEHEHMSLISYRACLFWETFFW